MTKASGEDRLCIDYRTLNAKTKRNKFPMPGINEQLDRLAGNKLFTTMDLASGYYQVPVKEEKNDIFDN